MPLFPAAGLALAAAAWIAGVLPARFACAAEVPILFAETTVPLGAAKEFVFTPPPESSQGSTRSHLEIVCRMNSPGLGGSMFFLKLSWNGREIEARKTRYADRLVNRPLVSPITASLSGIWHGHGGWRVLYAPDFQAAKAQTFYVDDPYRLVVDVTDLVNANAPNRLKIENTASPALASKTGFAMDLVVARVALTTSRGQGDPLAGAAPRPHVINRGDPGAGPAPYRGELLPGGGFAMSLGEGQFEFETRISFPNAGLNRLDATAGRGEGEQPSWEIARVQPGEPGRVTARGPDYSLQRTVRFTARRVEVTDEIANARPGRELGLLVRHGVSLAGHPNADVRLAGNNDPAVERSYAPANPTVHIALQTSALGIVCEDDVLRNQAGLLFDAKAKSAGLETGRLWIPAGGKAVLRWSVYPVASTDYYDFVNLVRQDWQANFTVPGAWCFFGPDHVLAMPLADLKARLDRLGVNFACSWGGWVDPKRDRKRIGFGAEVLSDYWSDYRSRLKAAIARLHEARPGIKALVYYDSQRDTHPDAGDLYPDSRVTGPDGKHAWTDWGGVYSGTWSMVATLDNRFGKAMLAVAAAYLSEMGADGLYWDEMENVAFGTPLLTHALPDGQSCQLDPGTYTIAGRPGITALLGETHRLHVIEQVRARGGMVMGNGPAHTARILATQVPRMVEIQHNDTLAYEGNFGSPLGYQSSRPDFGAVTRALSMAMLPVGTRLDYEHEIMAHLFPFTPTELHSGYLLGRERIVTIHSGAYGWPGEEVPCIVRRFDARGRLRDAVRQVARPGPGRVKVDLQPGEAAVIERETP